MFVFFVVLLLRLNLLTAGLEPHFPLLPIPLPSPRFLALAMLPLVKVPLLKPVETNFIFWFVFFLQYGQYLLTVFGSFINYERRKWFLKLVKNKIKWPFQGSNWGFVHVKDGPGRNRTCDFFHVKEAS